MIKIVRSEKELQSLIFADSDVADKVTFRLEPNFLSFSIFCYVGGSTARFQLLKQTKI
jgi:hypothetical protein